MTKETFNEAWTPEPNSGCWLWTRSVNDRGYGQVYPKGKRNPEKAHRYSWQIHNGTIPAGLHVLHHCDTPACVNPAHLYLGTRSENMREAVSKGRHRGPKRTVSNLNGWISRDQQRKHVKRTALQRSGTANRSVKGETSRQYEKPNRQPNGSGV